MYNICIGFAYIYQSYKDYTIYFFFMPYRYSDLRWKIAQPVHVLFHLVPWELLGSYSLLHLSLHTRFPSPPPSCPPLPTTCGFYSPTMFAQRTNVSSKWTLKPISGQVVSSTMSSSQGFKEMWTAPRLRRFGDLRPAGRSLAWIAVHMPSYTFSPVRFVSRCVKAHEFARRTIAPMAVRPGILCPTD